jgi:hypothetical protein
VAFTCFLECAVYVHRCALLGPTYRLARCILSAAGSEKTSIYTTAVIYDVDWDTV